MKRHLRVRESFIIIDDKGEHDDAFVLFLFYIRVPAYIHNGCVQWLIKIYNLLYKDFVLFLIVHAIVSWFCFKMLYNFQPSSELCLFSRVQVAC